MSCEGGNAKQKLTTPTKSKIPTTPPKNSTQASAWLKTPCILQNGHQMAARNNSNFVTADLKNTGWKMALKIFIIVIRIC